MQSPKPMEQIKIKMAVFDPLEEKFNNQKFVPLEDYFR